MPQYDVVIIGGGHNGLVAAAYLAKAGKRVCVLERRAVLGGCASTEELEPGFRISPAAYVISLFLPSIIRELRLDACGLRVLPRDPSSFTPDGRGRSLILGPDRAASRASIAQFSQRDAERYPRYEALLTRIAERVEPAMMRQQNAPGMAAMAWSMLRLGRDLPSAIRLGVGAARPMLERWFESEILRATLATDAIIGAWVGPSTPGSAYVLLHHVMGESGGARGVWGYVRGGMGGLADALEHACKQLGVTIHREASVKRIVVDDDVARGVELDGGEVIEADAVASSIDATQTLLRLVDPRHLPDGYEGRIKAIDYRSGSAKVNLTLSAMPDFDVGERKRGELLRGTIHLSPTMAFIERAFADALAGRVSTEPVVEITIPSTVDDTLAPAGKHVMGVFLQYVPYGCTDRELVLRRVLDIIEKYAPNIRRVVRETQVLLPRDLEARYGLTGGNIFQGAMTLGQLGPLRTGARTPIRGLYLCGAAIHPGGGVMGACGRNAAAVIERDLDT